MFFNKIDENTVECHMTEEEMNEFGVDLDDLLSNQEKAREFCEKIFERASEEIGCDLPEGFVSMQFMRSSDGQIHITFSDRNELRIMDLFKHLQEISGLAGVRGEDGAVLSDVEADHALTRESFEEHRKKVEKQREDEKKRFLVAPKLYVFDDFESVEKFADSIFTTTKISSRLYRDKNAGKYYLHIKKGKLKANEYISLCERILDYAEPCQDNGYGSQYCKEHFECMIGKYAINVLKEI